uniref:ribosomal protein S3 n=1 Tax=Kalinella pachyderma TaxID=2704665 RepID=UPI002411313B|nr:ribosomal protein S3 [Kalinella pachyderma]WDY12882.1 ribosomal protein S3 [Kalinella pachyderma]
MGQKVNPQGFRLGVSQPHVSHWFAKNRQYSELVLEDHFLRDCIHKKFQNAGIAEINIERQVDTIKIEISSARPRQLLGSFNKDQHLYTGIQLLRDQLTQLLKNYRLLQNKNLDFTQRKQSRLDRFNVQGGTSTVPVEITTEGPVKTSPLPLQNKASDTSAKTKQSEVPLKAPLKGFDINISIHLTKLAEPDTSAACLSEFIVEQLEKRIPFRRAMKQAILKAQKANIKGIKVQIAGRLNGAEIARSEWILKGRVPLHTLRAKVQYSYRTARTIYGLLGVKVWAFTDENSYIQI